MDAALHCQGRARQHAAASALWVPRLAWWLADAHAAPAPIPLERAGSETAMAQAWWNAELCARLPDVFCDRPVDVPGDAPVDDPVGGPPSSGARASRLVRHGT